jgi:hypothetical protein
VKEAKDDISDALSRSLPHLGSSTTPHSGVVVWRKVAAMRQLGFDSKEPSYCDSTSSLLSIFLSHVRRSSPIDEDGLAAAAALG